MEPRTFVVLSDRVSGLAAGDTVSEDDLSDLNVDALVAAGHLEVKKPKAEKTAKEA